MRLMFLCTLSIFIMVTGARKPQSAHEGKPRSGLTKISKFNPISQGSGRTGGKNVPIPESDDSSPLNTDKASISWFVQHMRSYMAKTYLDAKDPKEIVKELRKKFVNATDTATSLSLPNELSTQMKLVEYVSQVMSDAEYLTETFRLTGPEKDLIDSLVHSSMQLLSLQNLLGMPVSRVRTYMHEIGHTEDHLLSSKKVMENMSEMPSGVRELLETRFAEVNDLFTAVKSHLELKLKAHVEPPPESPTIALEITFEIDEKDKGVELYRIPDVNSHRIQ
ncbi:hypothetical protein OXX80_003896 [Metschnikowia pulcherrima]